MDNLLKSMGFLDIVHYKSGTEKYPKCLTLALTTVLETYIDEPFLLLEDDVEYTGLSTDIDIPENADAIYLGLSRSAGHPIENRNIYYAQFDHYSSTQVRVMNMLGSHAIFYNSKRYKQAVIDILNKEWKTFALDVSVSRIQPIYNIYANMCPLFFQSNKFNNDSNINVEAGTKLQVASNLYGWFVIPK